MPTPDAEIIVLARQPLGPVHANLFGQFIELAGRCVNDGLYDPQSPLARADGIRTDVLQALKELRPGYLRYPGGCATAYFDWQDLVGPPQSRPRAKLFRGSGGWAQSTAFGIPEAWALAREMGAELYLSVNAHTQSPEDAAHLVEYLNSTQPTKYADLRRQHGREEPYGVKLFGLGNEIYGNWQPGQKTANEYIAWCAEAIRQMKAVDPTIQVVACGLGRPDPEWDRTVLLRLLGQADMISVHNYFGRPIFADSMAASLIAEQMLDATNHIIDEVMDTPLGVHSRTFRDFGAPPAVTKRPAIAFDEWGVWFRTTHQAVADVEEIYDYTDALTVASLLHAILRSSRTVAMANISLAVNTIATLFTDRIRMVRQTIWYSQKLLRDAHTGQVLTTHVDGPTFKAKHERFFCGIVDVEKARNEKLPTLQHFDNVPAIDAVTSIETARRTMTISIVQKLADRLLTVRLDLHGLTPAGNSMTLHRLTGGDDLGAQNTLDHPDRVGIERRDVPLSTVLELPPASLTVVQVPLHAPA